MKSRKNVGEMTEIRDIIFQEYAEDNREKYTVTMLTYSVLHFDLTKIFRLNPFVTMTGLAYGWHTVTILKYILIKVLITKKCRNLK